VTAADRCGRIIDTSREAGRKLAALQVSADLVNIEWLAGLLLARADSPERTAQ